jgi:enamine deaminase RidA (YjgF/YER057c/UK114 family)
MIHMITQSKTQQRAQISFRISDAGDGQAFFAASVRSETGTAYAAGDAYSLIAEALRKRQMEIVQERIFGSLDVEYIVKTVRKTVFQEHGISHDTPITYIQGSPPWGKGFAGVLIRAVGCRERDDCVWTIKENSFPVGRGWQRKGSRFLILQNVRGISDDSQSLLSSRLHQAQRMFENAYRMLIKQGASYHDVLRTWIYVSSISEWYREFNHARNYTYDKFGIKPLFEIRPATFFGKGGLGGIFDNNNCFFPASTGIEGRTSSGAACTMDLIAAAKPYPFTRRERTVTPPILPLNKGRSQEGLSSPTLRGSNKGEVVSKPLIRRLINPSQAEAFHYYSAFSRGVLIEEPDISLIQVSGTAAIDEYGTSLFPCDIRSQIACTLEKIESLIDPEGASLKDICAATVFMKRPEYAEVFHEVAASWGLKELPHVCVVADICREELLFEMDAEVAFNAK